MHLPTLRTQAITASSSCQLLHKIIAYPPEGGERTVHTGTASDVSVPTLQSLHQAGETQALSLGNHQIISLLSVD